MLSTGLGFEFRNLLSYTPTCWTLTNRGMANDGLTPNEGDVRSLASLIGLRLLEVNTYPGGAKVLVEQKRLYPPAGFELKALLNAYANFDAQLEALAAKQAKLFLASL